jgi:hypothetical protein
MKMIIRAVAVLTLVGAVLVVKARAVEWPKHMQVVSKRLTIKSAPGRCQVLLLE